MDGLEGAVVVVMCVNLMLILGQFSAMKINPEFQGSMIDCKNSPLGQYGNCTSSGYDFDSGNPNLPASSTSVNVDTGNVMTDLWNTIKGFFADTLGLKYVTAVVGAPASFLKGMNIDPDFSNLIGGAWWVVSVLLIISYIKR